MKQRFLCWIGQGGLPAHENQRALTVAKYFNIALIGAILFIAFEWHLEFEGVLSTEAGRITNIILWGFFVSETLVMLSLVNRKVRYLAQNWFSLVVIAAGIPLFIWTDEPFLHFFSLFRLVLLVGILVPWLGTVSRFLSDNRLDTTILAVFCVLILSGIFITKVEPSINSVEEGIWWAWVTVSTVGYGDVVPTTPVGRFFAGGLILLGMGLFSVITANFAAIFIQRKVEKNERKMRKHNRTVEAHLKTIEDEETAVLECLKAIDARLAALEQRLDEDEKSLYRPTGND